MPLGPAPAPPSWCTAACGTLKRWAGGGLAGRNQAINAMNGGPWACSAAGPAAAQRGAVCGVCGVSVGGGWGREGAPGCRPRAPLTLHPPLRRPLPLWQAFKNLDWSQFKLVFEALHERNVLLRNAPYLSNPLPIMTVRPLWLLFLCALVVQRAAYPSVAPNSCSGSRRRRAWHARSTPALLRTSPPHPSLHCLLPTPLHRSPATAGGSRPTSGRACARTT